MSLRNLARAAQPVRALKECTAYITIPGTLTAAVIAAYRFATWLVGPKASSAGIFVDLLGLLWASLVLTSSVVVVLLIAFPLLWLLRILRLDLWGVVATIGAALGFFCAAGGYSLGRVWGDMLTTALGALFAVVAWVAIKFDAHNAATD